MTDITDVLNDPEGRRAIDALEDILSSLRGRPDGDPWLERIRDDAVADIAQRFGFTYQL